MLASIDIEEIIKLLLSRREIGNVKIKAEVEFKMRRALKSEKGHSKKNEEQVTKTPCCLAIKRGLHSLVRLHLFTARSFVLWGRFHSLHFVGRALLLLFLWGVHYNLEIGLHLIYHASPLSLSFFFLI